MRAPEYTRAEAAKAFELLRQQALAVSPSPAADLSRPAAILLTELKRLQWQLEAADEAFAIISSDDKTLPFLPIPEHDEWTEWIVTALKNAGFWQLMRERSRLPE